MSGRPTPIRRPGSAWRGRGPADAAATRPLRLLHDLVSLLCVTLSVGMVVAVLWSIPS